MRLITLVRNDLRLQFRHGFYAVYLVISVMYVVFLRGVPQGWRELLLPFVIFTDPAITGFVFLGAIFLLEKEDGSLQALFVTPVREWEYLVAKTVALTLLALVTSLAIAWAAAGPVFNVPLFVAGVALTSIFFTLLGMMTVLRFAVFNRFFLVAGTGLGVLWAPALAFFGIFDAPWLRAFPTDGALALIGGAFGGGAGAGGPTAWGLAGGGAVLVFWSALGWAGAHRGLKRYVLTKVGAGA